MLKLPHSDNPCALALGTLIHGKIKIGNFSEHFQETKIYRKRHLFASLSAKTLYGCYRRLKYIILFSRPSITYMTDSPINNWWNLRNLSSVSLVCVSITTFNTICMKTQQRKYTQFISGFHSKSPCTYKALNKFICIDILSEYLLFRGARSSGV